MSASIIAMTRFTFQAGLLALIEGHHPSPPEDLPIEVERGVATMIEAAIRSAGEDGLRPEVIYAIRASKLAARLLPAEVYRDVARRAQIKHAIRVLIRRELTQNTSADS
ncbi:MAG: hypothetical protein AAFV29_11745 [Myxococcota bacterium]